MEELFETIDLYEILGLVKDEAKSYSSAKIKKSYHKKSLQYHPDRVQGEENKELATRKFQALSAVYKVLSDESKKSLYDETGEIDEESDGILNDPDRDWVDYWRLLFKKVTITDITNFEKKYRGSEEEMKDLKAAYVEGEGNMDFMLDNVLCCTLDDEERFSEIIRQWIEEGSVPAFKAFTKESDKSKKRRKKERKSEAAEAEDAAREMGLDSKDENSLMNMIMKRQAARAEQADNFLDQLAAKYAKPAKKSGKKK